MAGKIVADTLEHSTAGSIATSYVVDGSAKAWLGAENNATHRDTLNFSSSSDDGTGIYTHTLTSSMAGHMERGGLSLQAGGGTRFARYGSTNTTESVREVRVHNTSGSYVDSEHNEIVIGDLA